MDKKQVFCEGCSQFILGFNAFTSLVKYSAKETLHDSLYFYLIYDWIRFIV